MSKPTAKRRKTLRAALYYAIAAMWAATERQCVNRKIDGRWQDTQSRDVLAACDMIEESVRMFREAYQ